MSSTAHTPQEYINSLPGDRKEAMNQLRNTITAHLPEGFREEMSYGMIGYVVPHSLYPAGYRTNPKLPLPFICIASQKSYIALHHMGLYGDEALLRWFQEAYPRHSKTKLDMGKGCIRFKKPDQIPFALIGELVSKITPQQWIAAYEKLIRK